jgi:hypothetical protein
LSETTEEAVDGGGVRCLIFMEDLVYNYVSLEGDKQTQLETWINQTIVNSNFRPSEEDNYIMSYMLRQSAMAYSAEKTQISKMINEWIERCSVLANFEVSNDGDKFVESLWHYYEWFSESPATGQMRSDLVCLIRAVQKNN